MKTLFHRFSHTANHILILFALALGACGARSTPINVHLGDQSSTSDLYCGSLYNAQSNMLTKMEACQSEFTRSFRGLDIPGFFPRAGYCGETFGALCNHEDEALRAMESCVALMPVCEPQRVAEFQELWRNACLDAYNKYVKSTACHIQELPAGLLPHFVNDEEE